MHMRQSHAIELEATLDYKLLDICSSASKVTWTNHHSDIMKFKSDWSIQPGWLTVALYNNNPQT